jgi:hypothetical protein
MYIAMRSFVEQIELLESKEPQLRAEQNSAPAAEATPAPASAARPAIPPCHLASQQPLIVKTNQRIHMP